MLTASREIRVSNPVGLGKRTEWRSSCLILIVNLTQPRSTRRASQWGWSVGMSVGSLSYVDRCGKTQPTEHPDLHESGWIKLGTSEHARTYLCSSLATWSSYLDFAVTTEVQPGSIRCSKTLLPLNCFLSECFILAPEMKLGQTEWNGRWVYLLPGKGPLRTKVRIYSCRCN